MRFWRFLLEYCEQRNCLNLPFLVWKMWIVNANLVFYPRYCLSTDKYIKYILCHSDNKSKRKSRSLTLRCCGNNGYGQVCENVTHVRLIPWTHFHNELNKWSTKDNLRSKSNYWVQSFFFFMSWTDNFFKGLNKYHDILITIILLPESLANNLKSIR